jgi:ATP/maltotriose-dependent transcriptional regulator MalT
MREAREFTEQREMRCMMPLLDLADGQVAAAHGNVDGSLALLARSEEAACRMEMRPLVLRAQMTTADLLAAVGRDEEAERKRSEAGRTIQDIAAQLQNEDIRAAFLAGTVGDERTVGEHGQTSNIHR